MDDETPGTTWTSAPAFLSSSASSAPRPNRNGSPPLRRTTSFPSLAYFTSSSLVCHWLRWWSLALLPASMTSASGLHSFRSSGFASASYMTTSAFLRSSSPLIVNRPGSPGPAPTR